MMNKIKIPLQAAVFTFSLCSACYFASFHNWMAMAGWVLSCLLIAIRYGK